MCSPAIQAAALAALLESIIGGKSRIQDTGEGSTRIEADLPDDLRPHTRSRILAALALADRYGHDRAADRDAVWAELDEARHKTELETP
ncbi:hypothetical protein [Streptomyces odonnellii]|uniref:hypothetical protein n=1 Tax=Streptomyces odonnellii TaxID=1417980 RepID=UPI000695ED37|nr:hypothetical protein [Streptomyces odonnellii]